MALKLSTQYKVMIMHGVPAQTCPTLCGPIDIILLAPLFMGFSQTEYWSGLPFPTPEYLPDPVMEPAFPALAGGFFITKPPPGKLTITYVYI